MHVYVWEHIASLYYRTAYWMFTKLCRDEVLMAWHMKKMFWPYLPRGRTRARQNRSPRGGPLLQKTSFSDLKATATNRIHSSDLEACVMKCCCFWFHSVVKFLTLEYSL